MHFDDLNLQESATKISELAASDTFSYVVTPNIDHLARLAKKDTDPALKAIYQEATLSLCDSRIIDKLLKMKGRHVKQVVPGSTLTAYLFDNTITEEDTVLVFGVEDEFIVKLRAKYPKLTIKHINPSMGFINRADEVAELIEQVAALKANYIFLSVGSPRQEFFAKMMQEKGTIGGVSLCVGASVLFLVGAEKRAPQWMQTLHLEWLFRMLQDPKRLFMRYFKNFLDLPAVYKAL